MSEDLKTIEESRQGEAVFIEKKDKTADRKKLYIESYGCAMNFSDSEIVASILQDTGYNTTRDIDEADIIFVNTCSIRDNAEQTVRKRLQNFNSKKKNNPDLLIGVLGCMAERLKSKLLEEEKLVDLVVGPDAYKSIPQLINDVSEGQKAVNVLLSREETYADVTPVRIQSNGVNAYVSIMRGCDNMCTFCVVPFTRGRERSRDPKSILNEAQDLYNRGYKEVTLLGQNVDSYKWSDDENLRGKALKEAPKDKSVDFAQLLEMVAQVGPDLRVRFSTSHPKDINDDVLFAIKKYPNICKYIHLPIQSGNTRILDKMNRTYSREWYLEKVDRIREIIPDCAITTDIMTGFCSETEEEHQDTIDVFRKVRFNMAFMYYYSERPGTLAAKKFKDDVSLEEKKSRLTEIIDLQQSIQLENNKKHIGAIHEVLVESISKKSDQELKGRNTYNDSVVFPKVNAKIGDYVNVKITNCTSATLLGEIVE